jgi:hypothetical protein
MVRVVGFEFLIRKGKAQEVHPAILAEKAFQHPTRSKVRSQS